MKIEDYVRTIPDYPDKGVNFYDLNSLFSSPGWFRAVNSLIRRIELNHLDISNIVGVESRGFVVGAAIAHEMEIPFTMVRKKGSKYPGELYEESYQLEYGSDTLVLQKGILGHTSRVLIVDDLIATGGSIQATDRLVKQSEAKVLGYATLINLTYLNDLKNVTTLWSV